MKKNKPFNVMSKTAIAAALLSTTLVPTAVAFAEEAVNITDIVVEQDDVLYTITKDNYDLSVALEQFSSTQTPINYIVVNGAIYDKDEYDLLVALNGSTATLEKLVETGTPVTIDTTPGELVDGKVDVAPIDEDFIVEDIAANNETSVKVTFPSNAGDDEDLNLDGTEITLTAGDTTLTAEFESFDAAINTAIFLLPEGSSLVDATTYTVKGKGFKFNEDSFQARFGNKVATTFEEVTSEVVAGETATVYFSAKDQYGDSIALTGQSIVAKGTLNGMPLTANELSYDAENEVVSVTTELNIEDELVITIGESTLAYTVIEGADPALSSFKIVAPETVASGETAELRIEARNQYNNPFNVEGQVRWVVNGDIKVAAGDPTYTFAEATAGEHTVQAYYVVNGKIQDSATITVTVEVSELSDLVADAEQKNVEAYTEESWTLFAEALKEAKAVLEKEDATQTEINGVIEKLQSSINALEYLAKGLIAEYESAVDSVEKVQALVADGESLQNLLSTYVAANNAVQKVSGEDKEVLQNRLDAAHDIATAADFVNGLQAATKNLTVENILQANIKLTSAKGNVNSLSDGDIKDALLALIVLEEEKIEAFDPEAPVIEYDGSTEITVENDGDFTVPQLTATDNVDETVEVTYEITDSEGVVLESIDTTVAGVYTITYTATDAAGNEATPVVITVTVEADAEKDTVAPAGFSSKIDGQDLVLTFTATEVSNLDHLEIDHNLEAKEEGYWATIAQSYEENPNAARTKVLKDGFLPEFKLYANENAFVDPKGEEPDNSDILTVFGVEADYDENDQVWKLTFKNGGLALQVIQQDGSIDIYHVVRDVDGNESGSMYDGSYARETVDNLPGA